MTNLKRHELMPDGTVCHASPVWNTSKTKMIAGKRVGTKAYPGIVRTPSGLKSYFYYAGITVKGKMHWITWREDEQSSGNKVETAHFASAHKQTVTTRCRDRFYALLSQKRGYNENLVKQWKFGLDRRYEEVEK
jgi:hypothetical protein